MADPCDRQELIDNSQLRRHVAGNITVLTVIGFHLLALHVRAASAVPARLAARGGTPCACPLPVSAWNPGPPRRAVRAAARSGAGGRYRSPRRSHGLMD